MQQFHHPYKQITYNKQERERSRVYKREIIREFIKQKRYVSFI